jgi:phosphoglycolate phosphatase
MRYQLVIFDWDGTLMDSAAQIVASMQASIVGLGLPARSDETLRRLIGLSLEDAFTRLYPGLGANDLMQLAMSYRRLFGSTPRVYGEVFPGVEQVLVDLSEQGRRLAVATGKSRRGLDKALAAMAWEQRFCATRCADETAGKPDPRMLGELLRELNIEPARALMVGDTSYDMDMARRAGMDAVGVTWGVHEHADLEDAGANVVLPGVPSLRAWLELTES